MSRHSTRMAACLAVLPGPAVGPIQTSARPRGFIHVVRAGRGKMDGALPVVRRLDIKDEAVQPLPWFA